MEIEAAYSRRRVAIPWRDPPATKRWVETSEIGAMSGNFKPA